MDHYSNEEEPLLKFNRLGNSVTEILKHDMTSCLDVHDKVLALGTSSGMLYILDSLLGNEIKRFPIHQSRINDCSLDEKGEFVASCSNDGTVVVCSLFDDTTSNYTYHRPVNTVCINPRYHHDPMFACGGVTQQLIVNTKSVYSLFFSYLIAWFISHNNTIHSGEGAIYTIRWKNHLIAWANDLGVKIFDIDKYEKISFISRHNNSINSPCHLCWGDDQTLFIGWGDSVKIGRIKQGTHQRYFEIICRFQTDFIVCGVCPFLQHILLLAYLPVTEQNPIQRPQLRIMSYNNDEISSDALPLHGWEHYNYIDYNLRWLNSSDPIYYIVSPKDIVVAKNRDLDDHLSWLLSRGRFKEAIEALQKSQRKSRNYPLSQLQQQHIKYLIDMKQYEQTAALCPSYFNCDFTNTQLQEIKELLDQKTKQKQEEAVKLYPTYFHHQKIWTNLVMQFCKLGQLTVIIPFIPLANPQLDRKAYEIVLHSLIKSDESLFLATIQKWPSHLYHLDTISLMIQDQLKNQNPPSSILNESLAHIYVLKGKYNHAITLYINLSHPLLFKIIKDFSLYSSVSDKILPLFRVDYDKTMNILLTQHEIINVNLVVSQLSPSPQYLFHYLDKLSSIDISLTSEFHERLIHLYCQFAPSQLLSFLHTSHYYVLEKAYSIVSKNKLYDCMIYLLGRMGLTTQALHIIIEQCKNVKQAVEFIQEYDDEQLWQTLIESCLPNPELLGELLDYVSAMSDPLQLLKVLPLDLAIPKLRQRIIRIFTDYILHISILLTSYTILQADVINLQKNHIMLKHQGLRITPSQHCSLCDNPISNDVGIVVFFCGHIYHQFCLSGQGNTCYICRH